MCVCVCVCVCVWSIGGKILTQTTQLLGDRSVPLTQTTQLLGDRSVPLTQTTQLLADRSVPLTQTTQLLADRSVPLPLRNVRKINKNKSSKKIGGVGEGPQAVPARPFGKDV